MILVIGFLVASCSQEDPSMPEKQENAVVSFIISDEFGATRNGLEIEKTHPSNIDKLICGVYDSKGNLLPELGKGNDGLIILSPLSFPVSLPLTLVKGQTYRIVLWAQNKEGGYDIKNGLQNIEADYSKIATIDPNAEVFSKSEIFTVVGNETRTINLYRAVANINISMTGEDYSKIKKILGESMVSRIFIPSQRSCFDALTDKVLEETMEDYSFLPSPITEEGDNIMLASTFVFAPLESEMKEGVCLDLYGESGSVSIPLEEIPIQRNWATNITLLAETVINAINNK